MQKFNSFGKTSRRHVGIFFYYTHVCVCIRMRMSFLRFSQTHTHTHTHVHTHTSVVFVRLNDRIKSSVRVLPGLFAVTLNYCLLLALFFCKYFLSRSVPSLPARFSFSSDCSFSHSTLSLSFPLSFIVEFRRKNFPFPHLSNRLSFPFLFLNVLFRQYSFIFYKNTNKFSI